MIRWFWDDEDAVSMPEYAVFMAMVAVASIGAITLMRGQFVAVFSATGDTTESAGQ
jgi:Flp pilus assembly pilin Flp